MNKHHKHTSRQTKVALARGDEAAFLAICNELAPAIHRYIFFKVGQDRVIAEDLTQETFVKLWEYSVRNSRAIDSVSAFVYRVARNLVIDHWRSSGRRTTVPYEAAVHDVETEHDSTESAYRELEEQDLIAWALEQLPEPYQEIIRLRYIEGLDVNTIGRAVGKRPSTVYFTLTKAMKSLQTIVTQQR